MKSLGQFIDENKSTVPVKAVVNSYLETALWADLDEDEGKKGINDIAMESKRKAAKDVSKFLTLAVVFLDDAAKTTNIKNTKKFWEGVGHNLWLTRNGHGAGFWDTPKTYGGDKNAKGLTKIADKMGNVDLYVGDDGKVYIE